ncbi:hypothetical protein J2Z44_000374 [Clostridium punense]|uniref:DUF4878 domain-containing protein n=1 Tax=Clostridium punense TaxID=1054297 RepID=A0ABS4JYH9_9CLOT|nr:MULTISPECIES: DUF4878 domain-containing protein [Clostridium]EQB87966.1 hypothetical protein M918_06560 [Clostridium sp. BL8]MBP2020590.1 hypothetical protein [Clostridium punense]
MKGLKKAVLFILLLTFSVGVYGCSSKTPSNSVKNYLEEVKKGENTDFSKLLNETLDKAKKEETNQKKDAEKESTKKFMDSMKNLTYTINSEKIDGDSATVNVKVNGPDMATVLGDFLQKAFTTALSQAFSGNNATQEETDKLFDTMLLESLNNMKYTERTGDISLTKTNGEWKINNNDALTKLLVNLDSSLFDSQNKKEETPKKEVKEMVLNQPFTVETDNGNYTLTIEGARATDKRNEFSDIQAKKVAMLDYTYENISFGQQSGQDLYIDGYAFQVLDDEGNVLGDYPVYDENRDPKKTPVGGKCKASATFAIPTDSANLNVTFTRGSEKVAKIIVPIK